MSAHLTQEERNIIQQELTAGSTLGEIAKLLGKAVSTISREVKKHRISLDKGAPHRIKNRCIHRTSCTKYGLCASNVNCTRKCSTCAKCNSNCPDYEELLCPALNDPPYVCNGCRKQSQCVLRKYVYQAHKAQQEYRFTLSDSRTGMNFSQEEISTIDTLISPLIKKGQSVYHIYATQGDQMLCSSSTAYRLIHNGALSARAIDTPRICRLRPRKRKSERKIDRNCLVGRTYEDFCVHTSDHPDMAVAEMDSVIGRVGGKCLLTIHLKPFDFMLAFIRDHNTAHSVAQIFSELRAKLEAQTFSELFSILLCDNGSEFSDPATIEASPDHDSNIRLFYCHPAAPYEKPHVELNHEFIRRILPKGSSFDKLSQKDIDRMMSHINSYARAKFGGLSPSALFIQAYGEGVLHLLGQEVIAPENIILSPHFFC